MKLHINLTRSLSFGAVHLKVHGRDTVSLDSDRDAGTVLQDGVDRIGGPIGPVDSVTVQRDGERVLEADTRHRFRGTLAAI